MNVGGSNKGGVEYPRIGLVRPWSIWDAIVKIPVAIRFEMQA
mgnify:CR=1 FL=1